MQLTGDDNKCGRSSYTAEVKWDEARNELYIPLAGHADLRLTPHRPGDEDQLIRLWSDPLIVRWTYMRPYPYTRPRAEWWIQQMIQQNSTFLPRVHQALRGDAPPSIHELRSVLRAGSTAKDGGIDSRTDDGPLSRRKEGEILGNVYIWPAEDEGLSEKDMLALPPKDQIWEIGYNLLPDVCGRGYGKGMILAALDGWIRWLGIGTVKAVSPCAGTINSYTDRERSWQAIELGNAPSRAVAASCGFKEGETFMRQWPEEKGGGEREMSRWLWSPSG